MCTVLFGSTPKRPPAKRPRMSRNGMSRALGAMVALAVVAAVSFVVLVTAFDAVGVPEWAASPVAVGSIVPAVLALADAYTPLGNRMPELRDLPRAEFAGGVALAAVVGAVVAFGGAYVLLRGESGDGLARLVVLSAAVVAGYVTFVARNLAVYRGRTR